MGTETVTLLLPGLGGANTESLSITNDVESFTTPQDSSRCGAFAVQLTAYEGDGTMVLRAQGSLVLSTTSTDWTNIESAAALALGGTLTFSSDLGPFSFIRFGVLQTGSSGSPDNITLKTVGQRTPAGY